MLNKFIMFLLFVPFFIQAQILAPVKWSTQIKDLGNNHFQLDINGRIEKGWHVYSMSHPDGGIGVPMSLSFDKNAEIVLEGKPKEMGRLLDHYNDLFEQQEKTYENNVNFSQKFKMIGSKPTDLVATISFQACDAEKCLPPDEKQFTLKVTPTASKTEETAATETNKNTVDANVTKTTETVKDTLITKDSSSIVSNDVVKKEDSVVVKAPEISSSTSSAVASKSLWSIFVLGFAGGLAALIMPCIFPMIPLTVSLFTKQSKTKKEGVSKAIVYGLSIIVIYIILGLLATVISKGSALNELASNPWVNLTFFVIFVIFALSFLGAFEITLPSKWINYADKGADKQGFIGIFFMAFTLALVSFSCTGPIIGSLLVSAAQNANYLALVIGMFGFSLALAIPFTLFAMFPGWLNSLPKSGGWLNTVKVTLGFIELAFALKFLSNADLVWQAGILKREVFLSFWIAIFTLLGLYLLGKIRLPLDSKVEQISVGRLFCAIITFSFVVYLIPGLLGAPLHIVSGLPPQIQYSEAPRGFHANVSSPTNAEKGLEPGMELGPQNIPAFRDLKLAQAYSKKVNKPIMIDFTGFACANCRKVEEKVWSDPKIQKTLTEDVILVSLYVDDTKLLPEAEQIYSPVLERKIKTIGNKWTEFEMVHYLANSQPLYSIVDADLKQFNEPMGAEYDVDVYLKWIEQGIQGYKKSH